MGNTSSFKIGPSKSSINQIFEEKDSIKLSKEKLTKLLRPTSPPVKRYKITSSGGRKLTHIKKIL